jgi:hypothetical protein
LKRNQAPDNEEEKVPVREGHETTLTDHEISEYFNRDRFPLYGLRCDFETCRESLKELLKDDKEALQIISDATSYQDLIKRLIRHPADVHSRRGQALRNATGLHPVFLDWMQNPIGRMGNFLSLLSRKTNLRYGKNISKDNPEITQNGNYTGLYKGGL